MSKSLSIHSILNSAKKNKMFHYIETTFKFFLNFISVGFRQKNACTFVARNLKRCYYDIEKIWRFT
jgi:hypothetical protein